MAKNKKNRFIGFFKDIKGELKKVTWPSFKQVRNNTLIVIICVLIIGAFIWILDAVFGFSFEKVIEKAQAPEPAVEQTAPAAGELPVELNIPQAETTPEASTTDTNAAPQQ